MTDADFDLNEVVRIRLLRAEAKDIAVLERQLGLIAGPPRSEPDITVRFVERLPTDGPLTYVGYPEAGYDSQSFFLLRGRQGVAARTILPFSDIGARRCAIVAERSVGAVPHLLAVINLIALSKGVLPLHASAFVLDGRGILATGWSKGGKTETLLAFAGLGGRYVADEWVYLSPSGEMFGLPEPIRLWHWHLRQLPSIWSGLSRLTKVRLMLWDGLANLADRAARRPWPAASVLRRGAPVLRRQAYRQVPPQELFGVEQIDADAQLDAVFLVTSHDKPDVTMEPITGEVVAHRMAASLAEERSAFMAHYRQFRFAFPDLSSDLVERSDEFEAELLTRVLAGRPAYVLSHPYPFELAALVGPVRAALAQMAGDRLATASSGGTS